MKTAGRNCGVRQFFCIRLPIRKSRSGEVMLRYVEVRIISGEVHRFSLEHRTFYAEHTSMTTEHPHKECEGLVEIAYNL